MYAVHHTSSLQMINVEQAQRRAHSELVRQATGHDETPRQRVARMAMRHRLALAGATALLMVGMVATAFPGGGPPHTNAGSTGSNEATCVAVGTAC